MTHALEGGLRQWGGENGWGPGPGRFCSVIPATDAGEHQGLAVPGAFAGDLESTVLFAGSAAAISKVLLPMGKTLKSPLQRSWCLTSKPSSQLCICSSRHAKLRVP